MNDPNETYDVENSFPMLIGTCVKYMRDSLNHRFRDAGFNVTSEQWILLVHLAQQDGISQQDLADRYHRSKVSAFNLIKKLEKRDLIIRRPDPVDGRRNRVFLTAKGRRLQHALIPLAKKNIAHMSRGVADEDIDRMKTIVRKITANLKR